MKIEIKIKYLIIFVGLIIASIYALLSVSGHRRQLEVDRLNIERLELLDSVSEYKLYVNNLERIAYESDITIIENEKVIRGLEDEKERLKALNLKNISLIGELSAEVALLRENVKPDGDTVYIENCNDSPCLVLPAEYNVADKWSSMTTSIKTSGLADMSFNLKPLDLHVTVGDKKSGFLKTSPVIVVDTENPYFKVNEAGFVVVDDRKNPLRHFVTGTIVGAVVIAGLSFVL